MNGTICECISFFQWTFIYSFLTFCGYLKHLPLRLSKFRIVDEARALLLMIKTGNGIPRYRLLEREGTRRLRHQHRLPELKLVPGLVALPERAFVPDDPEENFPSFALTRKLRAALPQRIFLLFAEHGQIQKKLLV